MTPRQVAECGGAFARGLRQHKIRACGKHFPGWGSVPVDALQGLAVSG
ncbi:MAG: beta-N-acetylhexosaminidase, partial [Acidobacteriia bacterium]|nr:beta-N-acetylhexosaminidase [Terriglobia bacterium]